VFLNFKILTGASSITKDVAVWALGAVSAPNTGAAVALTGLLVALVTHTSPGVAVARLARTARDHWEPKEPIRAPEI